MKANVRNESGKGLFKPSYEILAKQGSLKVQSVFQPENTLVLTCRNN